ncbi:uncharacterized protein LOC143039331 [Oratosquilla oratoria]|uniref:uncharacterized protein LOC143039331 n=1 Tax=Oratosquilla oratoria TaxID=337810 RepID=UPI003F772A92
MGFNSVFSFSSFSTSKKLENAAEKALTYKIKGTIYHRTSKVKPERLLKLETGGMFSDPVEELLFNGRDANGSNNNNKRPYRFKDNFMDMYFYHSRDEQLKLRTEKMVNQFTYGDGKGDEEKMYRENEEIIRILFDYLVKHNKSLNRILTEIENANELIQLHVEKHEQIPEMSIVLKSVGDAATKEHKGVYHLPTAAVTVGAIVDLDSSTDPLQITISSPKKGSKYNLQYVYHNSLYYDIFQYPILIPNGDMGFTHVLQKQKKIGSGKYTNLSPSAYYSSLLMERDGSCLFLSKCRTLFQRFVVDSYVKIESNRLHYFERNQHEIRKERSDILKGDNPLEGRGQRILLPRTYIGGPRYMIERQQDALTFVSNYGSPDFFITFTMNPKWEELTKAIRLTGPGVASSNPCDRPDLVSRIFKLKVDNLMKELTKDHIFVEVKAHLYSIEWQKRGLPHVHILLWMRYKVTEKNVANIISAEIPDKTKNPQLYDIVTTNMIHGPCVGFDESQICCYGRNNIISKCQKAFPKQCRSTLHFAIAYITKYVNKGSDRILFTKTEDNEPVNEIKIFKDARFVNANEATWKIFQFNIHSSYPAVCNLDLHLEGENYVFVEASTSQEAIVKKASKDTQLTAFFKLCQHNEFAASLSYHEIPNYFVYNKTTCKWDERKGSTCALGRIRAVNNKTVELFNMRMLLTHTKGLKSYEDLRTVEGVLYETNREAVKAMGLLKDEDTWKKTTLEIINHTNDRRQLRTTYASMLVFSDLEDQKPIWEETKDLFSSDFLFKIGEKDYNDEIYLDALDNIQEQVYNCGEGNIVQYGLPSSRDGVKTTNIIRRERAYNTKQLYEDVEESKPMLNREQKICYEKILKSVDNGNKRAQKAFFINAPGGTGKSFLLNLLLDTVRSRGQIALAVASSGIAATVLHGGRTAHNMFKIPLMEHNEVKTCSIKHNSELARLLLMTSLIVWDEAVMVNKNTIAALDITLRDLTNDEENIKFAKDLLDVGIGNYSECNINEGFEVRVNSRLVLVDKVYEGFKDNFLNVSYFEKRAIISPTNDDVDSINNFVYEKLKEKEVLYRSQDTASHDGEGMEIHTSVFNSMNSPSIPLHELKLKVGAVVMVMRNICPPKICNGIRVMITNLKKNVIVGKILIGAYKDVQTFERCGLLLDGAQCFAHGQLYVACSRITSYDSLFVFTGYEKLGDSYEPKTARNCVYEELFIDSDEDLSLRDIEEKLENVEDIEEMLYENTEQIGEVKNEMSNMLEEQGDLKNKVDEISAKLDNTLQSMSKFREEIMQSPNKSSGPQQLPVSTQNVFFPKCFGYLHTAGGLSGTRHPLSLLFLNCEKSIHILRVPDYQKLHLPEVQPEASPTRSYRVATFAPNFLSSANLAVRLTIPTDDEDEKT